MPTQAEIEQLAAQAFAAEESERLQREHEEELKRKAGLLDEDDDLSVEDDLDEDESLDVDAEQVATPRPPSIVQVVEEELEEEEELREVERVVFDLEGSEEAMKKLSEDTMNEDGSLNAEKYADKLKEYFKGKMPDDQLDSIKVSEIEIDGQKFAQIEGISNPEQLQDFLQDEYGITATVRSGADNQMSPASPAPKGLVEDDDEDLDAEVDHDNGDTGRPHFVSEVEDEIRSTVGPKPAVVGRAADADDELAEVLGLETEDDNDLEAENDHVASSGM